MNFVVPAGVDSGAARCTHPTRRTGAGSGIASEERLTPDEAASTEGPLWSEATEAAGLMAARELSGRDNVLYRRNSLSGAVEALSRSGTGVELNAALHA